MASTANNLGFHESHRKAHTECRLEPVMGLLDPLRAAMKAITPTIPGLESWTHLSRPTVQCQEMIKAEY